MDLSGACARVDAAVLRWGGAPTQLLQVLREVQETYNHVPADALDRIAQRLALPLARVRGVAAFYDFLATEPTGVYRVLYSNDVVDRMHGSAALLRRLCHRLWVEPGKPSEDGLVCVEPASFLGFPDQAPPRPAAAVRAERRPLPRSTSIAAACGHATQPGTRCSTTRRTSTTGSGSRRT